MIYLSSCHGIQCQKACWLMCWTWQVTFKTTPIQTYLQVMPYLIRTVPPLLFSYVVSWPLFGHMIQTYWIPTLWIWWITNTLIHRNQNLSRLWLFVLLSLLLGSFSLLKFPILWFFPVSHDMLFILLENTSGVIEFTEVLPLPCLLL